MELKEFDIHILCYSILIAFVLHFIFLRKHIVVFLDPWLILFLNQTMILSVFIYSYWQHQMLSFHFYYTLGCWFAFVVGLSFFYKKSPKPFITKTIFTSKTTNLALKFYLGLFFINGMLTFYFMGIPFFTSGNRLLVEYAKLGAGFGILSYMNIGLQTIIILLSIKVWLVDGYKRLALSSLLFVICFNILNGGGKSGYLDMITYICLGMYYMKRNFNIPIKLPKIFKKLLYILPIYILASFSSAVAAGYEANTFLALIRRIIGAAEGPYYYFMLNSYSQFKGLNIFSYLFSNVSPYFGYVDKDAIELGVNLTLYSDLSFGTPGFGPNPSMYVVGHIAFGYWGIIYCLFLGTLFSFLRYRLKASFITWLAANTIALAMLSDATLTPLILFYVILLSPILLIAKIFSEVSRENSLSKNKIYQ